MPVSRQELVAALQRTARGDRAAFRLVYEATSLKLYGIVVRILGRRDLADEVLQEVYVRVWQRAGDFDSASGSPITWLATIARNLALDEARRKSPRSIEEFPEVLELPERRRSVGELWSEARNSGGCKRVSRAWSRRRRSLCCWSTTTG